jgi:hypothetical protein
MPSRMDGRQWWQESADCLLTLAYFPLFFLILVCKSKVVVVAFKLCSVCWSVVDLFWCIVEFAPLNAVGSLLGYVGSVLMSTFLCNNCGGFFNGNRRGSPLAPKKFATNKCAIPCQKAARGTALVLARNLTER